MKKVFKFPIGIDRAETTLDTPRVIQPLCAALDTEDRLSVWLLVDPDAPEQKFTVTVVGTGWPVPEGVEYLGSVKDGYLVLHVFTEPLVEP